ncbi:MAG: TolC family protein [Bacteroidales bacterium]|mgnify:CR=1 FL=1|nr:TolC family protein [Bacteroidales bacterium]
MKILNIIPFFAATIVSITVAYSQTLSTLDECISYAISHNLEIVQNEIAVIQAKNNLQQAKIGILPELSAELTHNTNWGRSVDLQELEIVKNKTGSFSASAGISVTLFDGLRQFNTIREKKAEMKFSEASLNQGKEDLIFNVLKAYLQVLLSWQILNDAQTAHKGILDQKEKIAIIVEAGGRPYGDLLEISSREATERVNAAKAKSDLDMAYLSLRHILNLPDSMEVEINIPDYEELEANSIPNMEQASLLPQVQKATNMVDKATRGLSLAYGQLSPKIRISGGIGSYYSDAATGDFSKQFKDNVNPSIGITMAIPIFNKLEIINGIRNAKLSVSSAKAAYDSALLSAEKAITEAVYEAFSLKGTRDAAMESLTYAEETYNYALLKFNLGEISPSEYVTARMNLDKAQCEYHQAKYRYIFQIKILEYYRRLGRT